jgi:hypothetical protein
MKDKVKKALRKAPFPPAYPELAGQYDMTDWFYAYQEWFRGERMRALETDDE